MKKLLPLLSTLFLLSCEQAVDPTVCPENTLSRIDNCVEINLDAEIRNMPVCEDENCPLRAWGKKSKVWKKDELEVEFIGGDNIQRGKTVENMNFISSQCGLNFKYGSFTRSDIRIGFDQNIGHWSYVGIDCSNIPEGQATMNIALNEYSSDVEWRRVAQHETLHALAFHHSQQNPKHKIPWNEDKVIRYYKLTQGWDETEIRNQVLKRGSNYNTFNSGYDPDSIMHYPVDNDLTNGDFEIGWNSKMSENDIKMLQLLYGKP